MRTSRLTVVMLGAILASGIAAIALAQPHGMPPDPYDPNASTQPMSAQQSAVAPKADAALGSYQGPYDYPAAAVQAVPVAKAQSTVARAVYDRAGSRIDARVGGELEAGLAIRAVEVHHLKRSRR